MASPEDLFKPSVGYVHDIQIFDAAPREERDAVDRLMDLQQQAFRADRLGNYGQFGSLAMQMSHIERSIGNHSEAAAYADEAAEVFEQGGRTGDAIAARSTLAKEYRTLYSPDLALASLQDVLSLRTILSGSTIDSKARLLDADIQPVLRLLDSFSCTYLSSGFVGRETSDNDYPAVHLPNKSPRPSRDAVEELVNSLDQLLEIPTSMTSRAALMPLLYLSLAYKRMSHRRFGLNKVDRKIAKSKAESLGSLGFKIGIIKNPQATKLFDERRGMTVNDILQDQ
ncbi:MAG: hypothetical protein JWO35_754 [Candidatus Saccharibacteria bacterium]|nr:hypothetical protein [Candidatus Saccharibacteria bacterium]